jgi:uncharacterized protein (TIGR00251 family)
MALLAIRVTPRSAKPGIGAWRVGASGREELEIRVAEAPSDGAANAAVIRSLAKTLGVSRSSVRIISGQTGRHKRVEVLLSDGEVRALLTSETKTGGPRRDRPP